MYKLLLLIAIIFVSCQNRNDQMSALLNRQKAIKAEISDASYKESTYEQKSKEAYRASRDSLVYQPLIDSQTYYYMRGIHLKESEKEVQFSIDSLSKMN